MFWVVLGFCVSLPTPGKQVGIFVATYIEQYSFPLYGNRRDLCSPKLFINVLDNYFNMKQCICLAKAGPWKALEQHAKHVLLLVRFTKLPFELCMFIYHFSKPKWKADS